MYALARRVLDLAGSFSVAARRSLIVGMVCNVLKALFMAPTIVAVFWALEHRDALGPDVIWQCLALLLVSVAGQYAMQYAIDITMDARGFDIFRDLRLRVGDRLKGAAMGYFSEQRLGAITTTLTTTLHQLEEFMTICLTGLSGGLATAAIMGIGFLFMAPPVAAITFAGIVAGLFVLRMLLRRSGAVTKRVLKAQEAMSDVVMEYARGMAVLRSFGTPADALAAAERSFEEKRAADYAQEAAAQGLLKLYALVFNLASCGVLFAACALCLTGALSLPWALTLLVASFMIYGELIAANNGAFLSKKIGNELDRVDEVCDIPKQDNTDEPLAMAGYGVEFDHVSFGYGDGREVIRDVSLRIPEGSSCAIVGPSGSGKTTLVNLIARFWDVMRGGYRSAALMCEAAPPRACWRGSPWSFRTSTCSTTRSRATYASACPRPPTSRWSPRQRRRAATASSAPCRRGTTRFWRRAGRASRAVSVRGSPSPGRSSRTRPSSSSTRPRARSIPRTSTTSSPPCHG